ncbi:MAG: hypothetical protein GY832_05185 [Chloroflexi bacterium]|nr:hypothetical protein [Chloroflexota bacterium]
MNTLRLSLFYQEFPLRQKWPIVAENQWPIVAENQWPIVGENQWPIVGENQWPIVGRKLTGDGMRRGFGVVSVRGRVRERRRGVHRLPQELSAWPAQVVRWLVPLGRGQWNALSVTTSGEVTAVDGLALAR